MGMAQNATRGTGQKTQDISQRVDAQDQSRRRWIGWVFAVMTLAALLTGVMALPGCEIFNSAGNNYMPSREISQNPKIVLDAGIPRQELTLYGLHLGDPMNAIPEENIERRGREDWVFLNNNSRYRANPAGIYALGLWNISILDRMGFNAEGDIVKAMGTPAKIDTIETPMGAAYRAYRYPNRGIDIFWNVSDNHLTAINVMNLPSSALTEEPAPATTAPAALTPATTAPATTLPELNK